LAYWAGGDDSFTLQTLLGNDVASASNLAFGPNRVDALRDNAIDNISDDYSLMGVAGKGLSQIKVRPETIPLKQTSSGMWESIKYNTGTLAETALGTVGGKILGFLTVVKLGYDVGTFGGAAAVCAKQ
jgi:hypothetical protein